MEPSPQVISAATSKMDDCKIQVIKKLQNAILTKKANNLKPGRSLERWTTKTMPRQRISSDQEPRAIIKSRTWTAVRLTRGLIAAALKPSTLDVKRSLLRSFLTYMAMLGNPFKTTRVPYRFLIKFFAEELRGD